MANKLKLSHVQIDSLKSELNDRMKSIEEGQKAKMDQMKIVQEELKDSGDIATFEMDSEKMWLFLNRDEGHKVKIEAALKRMVSGNFGTCIECDSTITFKRLKFDPTTELCIDCKNELEQNVHFRLKLS